MKSEYIEKLLEKYYESITSLDEECVLKKYFADTSVPDKLKADESLFICLADAKKEEPGIPITGESFENFIKTRTFQKYRKTLYTIAGIAAVLIISFGLFFHDSSWSDSRQVQFEDTYSNPQEAYRETKKVLLLISQTMNKGNNEVKKFSTFSSSIDEMDKIAKFNEIHENLIKNQ